MRTAVAAAVTGFLGAAGAVVGFQQLAPAAQTEAVADPAPPASGKPRSEVRFAPCDQGFERQGQVCVRVLERTVVVDVAAPGASTGTALAPSGTSTGPVALLRPVAPAPASTVPAPAPSGYDDDSDDWDDDRDDDDWEDEHDDDWEDEHDDDRDDDKDDRDEDDDDDDRGEDD